MSEYLAYLVKISGRVTGVGFRYSTLYQAQMYPSLKGYVRNTGYGEVEVLLQGGQEDIDEMIAWLNHGPGTARVDKLSISKVPVNSEAKKFTIK